MSDKTQKKLEEGKAAVVAMTGAKLHMVRTLDRVEELEQGLDTLCSKVEMLAKAVPDNLYRFDSEDTVKQEWTRAIREARYLL